MIKSKGELVLIAEDSPSQAEQLKHMLGKIGYRAILSPNGKEALEAARRENPLLVISDIIMPELDGYELCRMIKSDDRLKKIPVILLTVLSEPEDVIRSLECGADGFITKPFREKTLVSRIRNTLDNREAEKEKLTKNAIGFFYGEKKYRITSDRRQILDLLLSTYDNSIQKNRELLKSNKELESARNELRTINNRLENLVEERSGRLEHLNSVLASIRNVNQIIVREKNTVELLEKICAALVRTRGYLAVWILLVDENLQLTNHSGEGYSEEYTHIISNFNKGKIPHCCRQGLNQSGILYAESHSKECSGCPMNSKNDKHISLTLRLEYNNTVFGILTIKVSADIKIDEEEIDLLNEITSDISFALNSIFLEEIHKTTEKELHRTQEKFNSFMKSATEAFTLWDENLNLVFINDAGTRLFQQKTGGGELIGRHLTEIIPDVEESGRYKRYLEVLETGEPFITDEFLSHPDFKSRYLTARSFRTEDGIGIIKIDITRRIEAEQKLAHEKDLLTSLIETSTDRIYFKDTQSRFLRVNIQLAGLFGMKDPSEALGKTDFDFFDAEHASQAFEDEQKVMRTGTPLVGKEEKEIWSDGCVTWASTSKMPLYDYKNNIIGTCGISRDITESKKADEVIRESEEKYRNIFNNVLDLYYEASYDGTILDVSPSIEILSKGLYRREDVAGKSIYEFYSEPERRRRLLEVLQEKGNVSDFEITFRNRDNSQIPCSVSAKIIFDTDGQPEKIIGSMRDITYRKLMERELIEARDRAEDSNRLKSAFLANMSHEIRTPLNVLLGFSDLLGNPDIEEVKRREFNSLIRESGNRLLHLIDDILDSAKIEAGQIEIREMEVDLNNLLAELFSIVEEQKRIRGKENIEIRLNTLPEEKNRKIHTDAFRLKQVLTNLLDNALKYTESGFIETGYSVLTPEGDDINGKPGKDDCPVIRFYVKDTGIGFPESKKDLIFERFLKIDDTKVKLYEGAGLGLTISRNLVRLLGGKMWAESEPDKGSTFFFTIRCKPPSDPVRETVPDSAKEDPDETGHSWEDKVILVTEDEENNYRLIEEILRHTGVRLIRAKDGKEAVDRCRSEKNIDLVLMDIKLPVMDGFESIQNIKTFRKDLRIIVLTAFASDEEREKSFEAGCVDYLSKPVGYDRLLAIIKEHI